MYNQKPLLGTLPNYAHPLTPIVAWLFNEGSGNKVFDIIKRNNGTFGAGAEAPTWVPEGLSFDGGDYVDCGDIDIDGNGAIVSWVNPNVNNADQAIFACLKSDGATATSDFSLTLSSTGVVYVYIGDNTTYQIVSANPSYAANKMQFIAATCDGSNVTVYVDNESKSTAQTIIPTGNIYKYSIGRFGEYSGFYLQGVGKTVFVYDRYLPPSQISQLYINPYCWLAQPMGAELMYAAPPIGAIMNQFQKAKLGADLYDGGLVV